jgi:hypothetical protein
VNFDVVNIDNSYFLGSDSVNSDMSSAKLQRSNQVFLHLASVPHFLTLRSLFHPEDDGSMFLSRVGNDLPHYKSSNPGKVKIRRHLQRSGNFLINKDRFFKTDSGLRLLNVKYNPHVNVIRHCNLEVAINLER